MPDHDQTRERFEALFRAHHPVVRAFARRRVPADSVDDIVSETFLVAWRRLSELPEDPLPWLLGVARNVVGTERRGEARRLRLWLKAQSSGLEPHTPGAEAFMDLHDGPVIGALSRLGERDREALILVAWDGLTSAQAAAVLGEPVPRFRVRLHRAGRRLRQAVAAEPQDSSNPEPSPARLATGATDPRSQGVSA